MIKILIIDDSSADQRIDRFLKRKFQNLSQSFIEKNLRKKNILLNKHLTKSNQIIKVDDKITIKNFLLTIKSTVSNENAEKVVKEPKTPIIKKYFIKSCDKLFFSSKTIK